MSERKQVMVDPQVLAVAVGEAFKHVKESDGSFGVVVPLGQAYGVVFELAVYAEEGEVIDDCVQLQLDDPVVYEQLPLNFLH